ncbi:MAG: ComEC/Rec2 family competence protein, partial [Acidobacteria bacterium]|nr:ComEC/Rec2 family competence protein [Acidobacteriota bacterium]
GGALAFSLLGAFLAGSFYHDHWERYLPQNDIQRLVAGKKVKLDEPVRLTGWISDIEARRGGDEMYLLRLEAIESGQVAWPASGKVRLQHYRWERSEPRLDLRYGERVAVLARLRAVRGFHNPGSFDRETRARREGAVYSASIKAAELAERLPGRGGYRVAGWVVALRITLLQRLDALFPPESAANGLLRAMLLGDRSGLDRRLSEDFQKTGTYHALVVAGLHTGAVAGFLLLVLRWCRVPPIPATAAAICGLAAWVPLTGGNLPAMRAALMFAIYLLARLVYRERALLNTIAAAALLLLAAEPAELDDAGFQLSFFSVLLIATIALPWIERTSAPYRRAVADMDNLDRDLLMKPRQAQFRLELRMLREALREKLPGWCVLLAARAGLRVYELAVVSLVLQVGFLLPMAVHFHRAAWVSVSANLLIVPLLGLVVPLGITALLVALASTTLAGLLAIPLAALVELMAAIARWHASLGAASLRVPGPPLWLALLFLASVVSLAIGLSGISDFGLQIADLKPGPLAIRNRSRLRLIGPGVALAIAAALITWHPFAPLWQPGRLEVTTLDVGQGDALLIVIPPGRVLVTDCGGLPGPLAIDTGEQIVSPYLWSRRIRRIDVLAVTHAHQDHVGGLESILRNFPVGEIWLPPSLGSEAYARVFEMAQERRIPVRIHARGETTALGQARIAFLSPGPEYHPGRQAQNNDSLVMSIQYGGRTALLAGDVERKMELEMLRDRQPLGADLLKTPHHGSKTSNSAEFLAAVAAPYGVISVAVNSPFGHPHQEALERLAEAHCRVLRTDRDGAVTWTTDGRRIELTMFAWEHPRTATDLW